jgi:hypothetical protein
MIPGRGYGYGRSLASHGYGFGVSIPIPVPETGSGGGYFYFTYEDDELEKLRVKSKHNTFVREAAVEAVVSNYYSSNKKTNNDGLERLKIIASDLEFRITNIDIILLKAEIRHIRMVQEMEAEEILLL